MVVPVKPFQLYKYIYILQQIWIEIVQLVYMLNIETIPKINPTCCWFQHFNFPRNICNPAYKFSLCKEKVLLASRMNSRIYLKKFWPPVGMVCGFQRAIDSVKPSNEASIGWEPLEAQNIAYGADVKASETETQWIFKKLLQVPYTYPWVSD